MTFSRVKRLIGMRLCSLFGHPLPAPSTRFNATVHGFGPGVNAASDPHEWTGLSFYCARCGAIVHRGWYVLKAPRARELALRSAATSVITAMDALDRARDRDANPAEWDAFNTFRLWRERLDRGLYRTNVHVVETDFSD